MATEVKTYNPAAVEVNFGGFILTGFAPGTMIDLVPDVVQWEDDSGVDGEPTRWRNQNPFDTLTLFLAQTSVSNFVLSNLLNADLATQAAVFPMLIMDNNTSGIKSTYVSSRGWIVGQPRIVFAGAPNARQWVFRLLSTFYNTQGVDGTPAIAL